jgi:predicted acyl esterase
VQVGIFGKSWGGFNGLQIASMRPPSLAAVIAAYVTDDRYAVDVHYDGGCVVGSEMLSWSVYMFALNTVPPDPRNVSDWKNQWECRLREASAPWVVDWLRHQTRDDFWKYGSVCEDYSQINIPALVVGRW